MFFVCFEGFAWHRFWLGCDILSYGCAGPMDQAFGQTGLVRRCWVEDGRSVSKVRPNAWSPQTGGPRKAEQGRKFVKHCHSAPLQWQAFIGPRWFVLFNAAGPTGSQDQCARVVLPSHAASVHVGEDDWAKLNWPRGGIGCRLVSRGEAV